MTRHVHTCLAASFADRALAGIALLAIARPQPKKEICLSNQHGLLGEDACHRALR